MGGCAALIDAFGGAIHHICIVHKYIREEERPGHTLFEITTDGLENASRRYTSEVVKKMTEQQKEAAGWEFIFLGANIDAVETAKAFGIDEDCSVNYVTVCTGIKYSNRIVEEAATAVRCGMKIGMKWKEKAEADYQKEIIY